MPEITLSLPDELFNQCFIITGFAERDNITEVLGYPVPDSEVPKNPRKNGWRNDHLRTTMIVGDIDMSDFEKFLELSAILAHSRSYFDQYVERGMDVEPKPKEYLVINLENRHYQVFWRYAQVHVSP